MLPITATPSAPPTWIETPFVAEPTPASPRRNRADDRIGRGRHHEPGAESEQDQPGDDLGDRWSPGPETKEMQSKPPLIESRPPVATSLLPNRRTASADSGAVTATTAATGRMRIPASIGEG